MAQEPNKNHLDAEISLFSGTGATVKGKSTIQNMLSEIQSGKFKYKILSLRETKEIDEEKYQAIKKTMPSMTLAGHFSYRKIKDLIKPSGFFHGDIDHIQDLPALREKICADPLISFCFVSPGGDGLKLGIRINPEGLNNKKYHAYFREIQNHFQKNHGVSLDEERKDVSGLCFVSYDPDLFINPKSEIFPELKEAPKPEPKPKKPENSKNDRDTEARKIYSQSAIEAIYKTVRNAPKGQRDGTLNTQSFIVGRFVGGGWLTASEAEAGLLTSASGCGFDESFTENKAQSTIRKGIEDGIKDPNYLEKIIWKRSKKHAREDDPNDKRPLIKWEGGELPKITDDAESEIVKMEGVIYQRGNLIVHPVRGKSSTVRGLTRGAGGLAIVQADTPYLTDVLTKSVKWERFDQRSGEYVRINAPKQVAETILSRFGRWKADPLVAIIETPTIRPDGTIIAKPGYDKATGLFFDPGDCIFPKIPEKPTIEEAQKSVSVFQELLSGFPFEDGFDFSVALAAILTALVRRVLKSAPMIAFRAPKMGSGKSLLADIVSMIGTGRTATTMSVTDDPEEEKKRLLSILMAGDSVICIDNVEKPYGSDAMCSILTQEMWSNRILGTNKTANVPTCASWLMTGNNITFVGDITTRVLPCNLDPQCERPEERDFSVNLYDYVPANRGSLVAAGLTILKAYIEAGKPKQDFKPFGRFEEWSDLVRSSIVWSGLADPCLSRKGIEEADPVRCQLRSVFEAWYKVFPKTTVSANEVIKMAEFWMEKEDENGKLKYRPNENLFSALHDVAPEKHDAINGRSLGRWLKKHMKRIEGGYKLEKMEDKLGMATWRVVKIGEGKSQSKGFDGFDGFPGSHPGKEAANFERLKIHEKKEEKTENVTVCGTSGKQTHETHETHEKGKDWGEV